MSEVRREEIDYEQFVVEAQHYLAEIRGGCPGGEQQALELTLANYPYLTEHDVRAWGRDPAFQRALKHARRLGEENRAYDQHRTMPRDPWSLPPRNGEVDVASIEYDAEVEKPRGGLGQWLRKIGLIVDRQAEAPPATPATTRTYTLDELTDEQWAAIRAQEAAEVARWQSEHGVPPQSGVFSLQPDSASFPQP